MEHSSSLLHHRNKNQMKACKIKNIIKKLIICRLEDCCITPWWMKRAYCDYMRREIVMVAFPLNYIVSLAWWLNLKWGEFRHKPTWLDAIIKQRAETRIK